MRILVAGVGNIFCGDDAYGVEVASLLLRRRALPASVVVKDFGIRGLDLAYALTDGYDAAIIIDAAARGEEPGAISVVEPERPETKSEAAQTLLSSSHGLDPEKVLGLVATLGAACERILFVLCEPLTLGDEEGQMGLSDVVAAAVEPSVELVQRLVSSLLQHDETALGAC
ncbi:MAG TPA: hydrogenase maturation protease [Methylocystis sp.]|nr:hydrogenase maturation protease [Methylocystis sp.]